MRKEDLLGQPCFGWWAGYSFEGYEIGGNYTGFSRYTLWKQE